MGETTVFGVRDYKYFPESRIPSLKNLRIHSFQEQIIMVHLLDPSTTIHSLLSEWDEFLSPPFRVTIDCSLILIDSNGDFRYNWAQVIISHLHMFPRNLLLNYFLKCHFDDNIFSAIITYQQEAKNQ